MCSKVVTRWLGNEEGELGETVTDIDPCDSYLMSNESSITCGITFRDSIVFKTFGEKKDRPKPELVPKLDLSNTNGMSILKAKCEKVIANGKKIQEKRPTRKESDADTAVPQRTNETSETKGTARNSKSLVPLPSHRVKNLISPKRRLIPEGVKRFSKLKVFDLNECSDNEQLRMTHSFKVSEVMQEEEKTNKHYKCSSMFVQSSMVATPPMPPPMLKDESKESSEVDEKSNKCNEIKLSIECSPKKGGAEMFNVLAPKTTINALNPQKQDDEVRFSTESWLSKTPGRTEARATKAVTNY